MATPFAPPRTRMGIGPLPLPGDENPYLSSTQQQRFQNAGLQSFLPYADPFATVARARGYQNMERNMANEDQMYDAEQGFMEAVRQDPQTGYQKFLQQNPLATMSPMVRAYLVSQRQFQPQQDKYAQNVAEMGTPYLQTYQKSRGAGKTDLEAFAEAVSQREADELQRKPTKVSDDRANLTGEPAERLAGIMSEIYETPDPTDEEKAAFLPKDKTATESDWTRAYYQAKEKKQKEAMGKLRAFQATYGEMFKVPGTGRSVSATPASAPTSQPEQALAPDPFAGLTTYGDSKAVPAPAGAVQAPAVAPATVTPPVVPEAPVAAADLKRVEPVTFESLQRQRLSEAEGEKRAREEEYLARQKQTEATSGQWEKAKNDLLQATTPADLSITELDFTGETGTNPMAILSRIGKKENDVAFTEPNGKKVTYGEVLQSLVADPRWKGDAAKVQSKDFSSLWGSKKG
jgi:hypothetical protein